MRSLVVGLGLLAMLLGSACAGLGARGDALPTLAASYQNVVAPIVIVGIGAEQDAGRISAERADELRALVVTIGEVLEGRGPISGATDAWDVLLPLAESGIDDRVARGEIGPGVGASIKEVLRLFAARLKQVGQARPGIMLTKKQSFAVEALVGR